MKTGTEIKSQNSPRTGVVAGQPKPGRAVGQAVWVRWDDGQISLHATSDLEVIE
jgi:hypothetical protein